MSLKPTSTFLAAALALLAIDVRAECETLDLGIEQIAGQTYNPSDSVALPMTLRLTPLSTSDCELSSVSIAAEGSGQFPPRLEHAGASLELRPGSFRNAVQVGGGLALTPTALERLAGGESVEVQIAEFAPGQYVQAGEFQATLEIEAGSRSEAFRLQTEVLPAMRFVSDNGRYRDLHLGDPTLGGRASVNILYISNANLQVAVTSEHGGVLVHEQGAHLGEIDYDAWLAGHALDLGGSTPFIVRLPFASILPEQIRLEVEVPPTPGLYAGIYRDVLRVSFTPY